MGIQHRQLDVPCVSTSHPRGEGALSEDQIGYFLQPPSTLPSAGYCPGLGAVTISTHQHQCGDHHLSSLSFVL